MDSKSAKYKISRNIESLRKTHGETQSELGRAIGVSKQAINNYELGERIPPLDRVIDIANHYDISIDRFLHASIEAPDSYETIFSYEKIMDTMDVMFPVFEKQQENEDRSFAKGIKQHFSIMKQLRSNGCIYGFNVKLESVLDAYTESFESNGCPESAANILSLVFFLWASTNKRNYDKASQFASIIKDFPLGNIAAVVDSDQFSESRDKDFCKDLEPLILQMIRVLKEDSAWSEVGDYYLALRFFIGLVDNDSDINVLREMGLELMVSYCAMGNEYAYRLLQNISLF